MNLRSVRPRLEPDFKTQRTSSAMSSLESIASVSTASASMMLASLCSVSGSVHAGNAKIVGYASSLMSERNAVRCSWPYSIDVCRTRCNASALFWSKSVNGAASALYFGTKLRRYPVNAQEERSASTVAGSGR